MPTVPRVQDQSVQDNPLPGARVSVDTPLEAYGGGQAQQALSGAETGLNEQVRDIAREQKRKGDQLAVLDADKQASAVETDMLYNPQSGALNKRGKDAFGIPDQVRTDFQKKMDDIESGLSNEDQRDSFRRMAVSRYGDIDRTVQAHVSNEIKSYDSNVTDSYVANERDAAGQNYTDPDRVSLAVERQRAAISDFADRNGMPSEWAKQKMVDAQSKTYSEVIQRMLANDQDMAAKDFYDRVKPQVSGEDQLHLDKAIEEGTLRGSAQRQSDSIMNTAKSEGDSLAAARSIQDPKLRDATEERVKQRFQENKAALSDQQSKLFQGAANIIEQNPDRDNIPPSTWTQLSLEQRNAIDARIKQLNKGEDAETDWTKYYDLKSMASGDGTRQAFADKDLMLYRADLADPEFKDLVNLQTQIRKGDDKVINGVRTNMEVVNDNLKAAGININPKKGSDDADKVAQFRRQVDSQVMQLEQTSGKKANGDDVQKVVDGLLVKTITNKSWIPFMSTTKPVFQLTPQDNVSIEAKDVPPAERAKIEDALKRHKLPVTDDAVSSLYSEKVKRAVRGGQQ